MKGILMIKILAGIALFSVGIAVGVPVCRIYDKSRMASAEAEPPAAPEEETEGISAGNADSGAVRDELQVRVRAGEVEWYDGVRWNSAGAVAELAAADPISQPTEAWQTLAAQLADTRAEEYAARLQTLDRENSALLVDEIVVTRPQNTSTAAKRPATPAVTPAATPVATPSVAGAVPQPTAPANSVPDNSDDNDDDDGPAPAPAPAPDPAPDDTGDGENIEWSGDYE